MLLLTDFSDGGADLYPQETVDPDSGDCTSDMEGKLRGFHYDCSPFRCYFIIIISLRLTCDNCGVGSTNRLDLQPSHELTGTVSYCCISEPRNWNWP